MRTQPLAERVIEKIDRHPSCQDCRKRGCWGWKGAHDSDDYPIIAVGRKAIHVKELMLLWSWGPPRKRHGLHDCDNRRCIRPEHLYYGSNRQNVRDRVARGRGHSVLTETKVKAMRRRAKWGWGYQRIGEWAGVSASTARMAVVGITWRNVK